MASATAQVIYRANSPVASSSAQRLRERWLPSPRVLLADEPTGNLDSENGTAVMNILASVCSAGCTVIMVTHSLEHAA